MNLRRDFRAAGLAGLWFFAGGACVQTQPLGTVPMKAVPTDSLVVVCGDYATTSVSVLDPVSLEVLSPAHVHSGSLPPGIGTALGGDVDLPSVLPAGTILLVDRYPNGILTWLDTGNTESPRQLNVGPGFGANPHDVLRIPDGRWLVTRYGNNPNPSPEDVFDRGDDVLILGANHDVVGRFDFAPVLDGLARPDRLALVGEEVWVSLNRASRDFLQWEEGRIASLRLDEGGDLELQQLIALPGLVNCTLMAPGTTSVAVACGGGYLYGAPSLEDAGILLLSHVGEEVARLPATDPRIGGNFGAGLARASDGDVLAVVLGDLAGQADRLISWSPDTDAVEEVLVGSGAFRLGGMGTVSGDTLIVDADPNGGRLCRLGDGHCVDPCPSTGLPPLQVRALGSAEVHMPQE